MRRSRRNGQIRRTHLAAAQVDVDDEQLAAIGLSLGEDFSLRSGDETRSPELEPTAAIGRGLDAEPVAGEQRQAVGHGVSALDGDPGVALAVFSASSSAGSQPIAVG